MSKLEPGESAEMTAKGGKLMLGEAQTARDCPKADLAKTFPAFAEGFQQGHAHALEAAAKAAQLYDGRAANAIRSLAAHAPCSEGSEGLASLVREYARDLRRNSSGGDDYPWEVMNGVADYLEILIERSRAVGASAKEPEPVVDLYAWPIGCKHPMEHFHAVRRAYEPK